MFSGIVEEMATVVAIDKNQENIDFTLSCSFAPELTIDQSVAHNGVCLTVVAMTGDSFSADVMAESLRRSALGSLQSGSPVNLERAMPADGRFGGHIVSGHIDGTGTILSQRREDNAV